jgi:lysozyme
MRIGPRGLALVKSFETLRLETYDDATGQSVPRGGHVRGRLTIGYGHTGADVRTGDRLTETEAELLLRADLATSEQAVARLIQVPLNQPQFDALASLVFNIGAAAFSASTLRGRVNAKDFTAAAGEFYRWRFDNGVELLGLARRRVAEMQLFLAD